MEPEDANVELYFFDRIQAALCHYERKMKAYSLICELVRQAILVVK